jgi:DNA modification methylase
MEHVRSGAWVSPSCTPQFTGDRPGTGWEACEIAHQHGRKRWNGGGLPAVWIVNRPLNGSAERAEASHPTPKPSQLLNTLVRQFTDPGETILDPFMGSGTTLIAAKRLGRKAIGIELNEKYCEIAAKRLAQGALPLEFSA